ncbi:MAG TPA: N-acetylneuraminate synthase [Candidatus Acidoferrales bacterium]|jgi:N,N'-diacetyllegionaminate synthase|nr:N-acetylneuraminate synthase [Candidatus Acidoferrales bacterium]
MSSLERRFTIAGRSVGSDAPCFIIAEAGVNHNGDLARALDLVDVAAAANADAVKFQTFDADRLATHDAPKALYQLETTGATQSQREMLRELQLSIDDHRALIARCAQRGIIFLSTPFDEESADLLASLDVPAFKTPSGELTNLPYLAHVARFGKPVIASTGMATLAEVESAVATLSANGCRELALLHCVSNYPAAPADVNLRAIETLERTFGTPAGYSDHTDGIAIALAAAARGAAVIEKHFTLDRTLPGPDHRASLEPAELDRMVREIRAIESALGDGRKEPAESERDTAAVARKSLVTVSDIAPGEPLTEANVAAKRPGTGLSPALRERVIGRSARVPIAAGTLLEWEMLN